MKFCEYLNRKSIVLLLDESAYTTNYYILGCYPDLCAQCLSICIVVEILV